MNSYDKINDDKLMIFSPIFIFRRNKIKLSKDNNFNNLKIKFHKKLISANKPNYITDLENKIKKFLIVMNSECKSFNSKIFYNNFRKTLFDLKNLNNEILDGTSGSVTIGTFGNVLKLNRFSATYHELLHLSSLEFFNDYNYSPFNEGYTQFLKMRYFKENNNFIYFFEVEIMKIIEIIIGQDKLEKLYFSGNFGNLKQLFQDKNSDIDLDFFYEDLNYIFQIEKNNKISEYIHSYKKCLCNIFETLLYCFLNNANEYVTEHIGFFKNYFCFSFEFEKDNQKYIIDTMEESKFYEIVNQYKNKNHK